MLGDGDVEVLGDGDGELLGEGLDEGLDEGDPLGAGLVEGEAVCGVSPVGLSVPGAELPAGKVWRPP